MMKSNLRARKTKFSGAGRAWLAGAALLCAANGAALAKNATLYIQRNDAGSVLQLIPLTTWSLDKARRMLRAESVAGGLVCPGKVVSKKSSSQLVLDGKAYTVDRITEDAFGVVELIVRA